MGSYAMCTVKSCTYEGKSLSVMEHALYDEKYKRKEGVGGYTKSGQ